MVEANRDAYELDITPDDARKQHIIEENETYVGRRIIATNISRELPVFIQYLTGSYRHICAKSVGTPVPTSVLSALEAEFTDHFRVGNWLESHITACMSQCLHGRGVFLVRAAPESPLNTSIDYIAPEDFIFPTKTRDLQSAPQIGIRYQISETLFKQWAEDFSWDKTVAQPILEAQPVEQRAAAIFEVFLMLTKVNGDVHSFWYHHEKKALLTRPALYNAGYMGAQNQAMPSREYPIFPVYYRITDNLNIIERKGRAHSDMHDQEALTMIWTACVNGYIRASEVYPSRSDAGLTENPEVTQTEYIISPGKITKTPLSFFSAPWPDSSMLSAAQALKTENSSDAGQVDFAATARKDSRKTAKELTLASEQSNQMQTIPLVMFSMGYGALLSFMWKVLRHNMQTGFNQQFMAHDQESRQVLLVSNVIIRPAGDIDYIERNEKLKKYTNYFQIFADKGQISVFFLKKILELAFPDEYQQMAPLLTDSSVQMGIQLLEIVKGMPTDTLPPEQVQKLQEIIAAAEQSFSPHTNAPTQTQAEARPQPGGVTAT